MITGSGTQIDLGIKAAREELMGPGRAPDHSAVMILLTDGIQSSGGQVEVEAEAAKAAGIVVFTIALGDGAAVDLLRIVASSPSHAYVAPTGADLLRIYARIAVHIPCPATLTPMDPTRTATRDLRTLTPPTPSQGTAIPTAWIYLPRVLAR